jgi:hypothetical protein
LDDLSEIVMDKRYLAPRKKIRKTTSGLDMVLRVRIAAARDGRL